MTFLSFFAGNGFVFEFALCFLMFTVQLKKRSLFWLRFLGLVAFVLGCSVLWTLYVEPDYAYLSVVKSTYIYALFFIGAKLCYRISWVEALYRTSAAYAGQHLAFLCANFLVLVIPDFGMPYQSAFIYVLIDLLLYGLIYLFLARRLKPMGSAYLENNSVLALSLAMLLFTTAFQIFVKRTDIMTYLAYSLYDLMCCMLTLWMVFRLYQSGKNTHDYAMMEHLLDMQKEQMKTSKRNIDLINIKCHDLKKQIAGLNDKISSEEISELNSAITIYDTSVKTGNETLDIVLAEKSLFCEKHHVILNAIADGARLNFMAPSDIYSLFGNALDNAIEAIMKADDKANRIISLSVRESGDFVNIHIENPYQGQLVFKDGLPLSDKGDDRYHGYGTKSIRAIAEKYEGEMGIETRGNVFSLNVLLPISQVGQKTTIKSENSDLGTAK